MYNQELKASFPVNHVANTKIVSQTFISNTDAKLSTNKKLKQICLVNDFKLILKILLTQVKIDFTNRNATTVSS